MSHFKYLCNPETLLRSYQILLKHYKGIRHYTMVEDLEKYNTWYYNSKFAMENAIKDWNLAQNDLKELILKNSRGNTLRIIQIKI